MAEIVYYKKEGKKFVPVSYYDSGVMDGVGEGATLVVKQKNLTMRRHNVDIAFAPMLAAAMATKDAVASVLIKASEARPHCKALTTEQLADWQSLMDKHGDDFMYIEYPSAYESIESAVTFLADQVVTAHTNEAVLEAWNHYKLLVALTLEKK